MTFIEPNLIKVYSCRFTIVYTGL